MNNVALNALDALISVDQDWIPTAAGTSLYIRPFIIATEPVLGIASTLTLPIHHHHVACWRILHGRC